MTDTDAAIGVLSIPKPSLGRIVLYRSKIDNGPGNDVLSPACIVRTKDTSVPEVIRRWGPAPTEVGPSPVDGRTHTTAGRPEGVLDELPDDTTVDLVVWGLGKTYREYAVRYGDELGQWFYPPREDRTVVVRT